ncbi:hypothetical protein [Methanogenium cariaci]|uniref:hypothetical protein n=1 Tax=Methanogenium cariaci TaxID=2197 RepID=UPI001FE1C4DB|nr:hypothetical protein [Methanogenium cariaci]
MDGDSRDFLYKYALQNAVMHNSVPKAGAVLGALMGKHPEFRPHAREYSALLGDILVEIEEMTPDERRARLELLAPELLEKKRKRRERSGFVRWRMSGGKKVLLCALPPRILPGPPFILVIPVQHT